MDHAQMVELVDTPRFKSGFSLKEYEFDSRSEYKKSLAW